MKGNMIAVIMAILALALAVISLFLLPDIVTVQIGADGQPSNTMPKELATLLFTLISLAGTVLTLKGKGSDGKKGFLLSGAGIVLMLITLAFNL